MSCCCSRQRRTVLVVGPSQRWLVYLAASVVDLVALVGVGSWLIASVVLYGMRPNSQPNSSQSRLAPAYPSSATPLNELTACSQLTFLTN